MYTPSEWEKFKEAQRGLTRWAIRRGMIRRGPCSVCGGKHAIAHHPDYFKPFDVVWMCSQCHASEHARLREIAKRGTIDHTVTVKTLREMRVDAAKREDTAELERIDRRINDLTLL